jgi:hypothetical protein
VSQKDGYEAHQINRGNFSQPISTTKNKNNTSAALFSSLLQEDPTKLVGLLFVKAFSPLEVITQAKK